jgi:glycosyltransferase involved in cell wall biosynthesis
MGARLSIVIPAYRERARLGSTLDAVLQHTAAADAELIVVDDGSDDGTADIAETALADRPDCRVIRLSRNLGKGAAVRAGVLESSGDVVVFMDADLASDLECLKALVVAVDDADIAVGSRTVTDSATIGGTRRRALMARVFNGMARPVMRLPIRDTQCGFKAFRRDAALRVFHQSKANRFAFDVELLTIARALGMKVVEVPVTWRAVEGTRVRFVDPLQMSADILRIAVRCRASRVRARDAQRDSTPNTESAQLLADSALGLR